MEALLSSPSAAIIGGSLLLMAVVYYGHGLAYAYLDLKHEPAALFRLKIQPKRGPSVEVGLLLQAMQ